MNKFKNLHNKKNSVGGGYPGTAAVSANNPYAQQSPSASRIPPSGHAYGVTTTPTMSQQNSYGQPQNQSLPYGIAPGPGGQPYGSTPGYPGTVSYPGQLVDTPSGSNLYPQPGYPAPAPSGYPGQPQPGYTSGYPATTSVGYPATTSGYPPASTGYPAITPGYPASNQAYPTYPAPNSIYPSVNPGIPVPNTSYPDSPHPGFPGNVSQGGYPPASPYPSSGGNVYPVQPGQPGTNISSSSVGGWNVK